jgi:hypothetical protein
MPNVSIKYALKEIADCNLICWSIRDNNSILAEQDDNNIEAPESIEILRDKLEAIGNGKVNVIASAKQKKDRKGAEAYKIRNFSIDLDKEKKPEMSTAYHSPQFEKLQHELLNLERENVVLKFKLEAAEDKVNDLEKKLAEVEKEESEGQINGIGQFETMINKTHEIFGYAAAIAPFVQAMFQQRQPVQPTNPVINGHDKQQATE